MRIVIIVLVVAALIGIFDSLISQGSMAAVQNIQTSITTIMYAGEIQDIKTAVDEFLVLRTTYEANDRKELAEKIDKRLNKLELVKTYCEKEISTLELSYENNPYEKIQQTCPKLKELSFSKAVQFFRLI